MFSSQKPVAQAFDPYLISCLGSCVLARCSASCYKAEFCGERHVPWLCELHDQTSQPHSGGSRECGCEVWLCNSLNQGTWRLPQNSLFSVRVTAAVATSLLRYLFELLATLSVPGCCPQLMPTTNIPSERAC